MDLDINLAAALIDGSGPEFSPHRILGVRLRRFSLWHKFLLRSLKSPFLEKGDVQFAHLRVAIGVCRLKYPDSRIRKPWLVPFLIYSWSLVAAFWPRPRHSDPQKNQTTLQRAFGKRTEAFLAYCGDYIHRPSYAILPPDIDGPTKPPRPITAAPDEIEIVADLIAFAKWDDRYIWNLPVGYANWLRPLAWKEKGHEVTFIDEKEKEFAEQLPPEFRRNP